jgi:muconolactone delta-isomerase
MDFLVEFEICLPPDYDPELLADLLKRERARAAEISAGPFFKSVWIVPCQRARIAICSAADAQELHETLHSLPAAVWNEYQVTPLIECAEGSSICIPT